MTSTPHTTRSRTRALRRLTNDKNKRDSSTPVVEDVFAKGVDSSETNEDLWEDVSDLRESTLVKPSRRETSSPASVRRTAILTPRRRKRARNGYTPAQKLTTASTPSNYSYTETPTKEGSITPTEIKHEESSEPESLSMFESAKRRTPAPHRAKSMPRFKTEDLVDGAMQGVSFSSWYIFDVCRTALALLKKPLGLVLFLWLLATILLYISQTLRAAFEPVCRLPLISSSLLCRPISSPLPPPTVNYPALMEAETKTFEQLLDEASGGSALSLEVKKAEMATSDLVTLVHLSTLTSKDSLARMLLDFVEDAKRTGRRLQKLHAKVGGSVDTIMAVNNHALRTIERANEKKGFSFGALMPGMERRKARIVTATFQDAMDTLSTQVERLVIEAEANIDNLNQLEESLNALYELVSREVKSVEGDRDELLALLWTKLGGNQKELKNFKKNLAILKNVGLYRNQARVHVTATLQTLRSLSEDMEEMRERVATPGLVGERIPLEVQMQSIQYGLDRLKENRMKAQRSHEAAVQAVAGAGLDEISA